MMVILVYSSWTVA